MRLELTRKSDLALKALRYLATKGGRVKAGNVAHAIGTSTGFLNQAMRPLVVAGWVGSLVGPTGGYELRAAAEGLSVRDLIEAVEGPFDDGRCVLEGGGCPAPDPCALHDAWVTARAALTKSLASTPVFSHALTRS